MELSKKMKIKINADDAIIFDYIYNFYQSGNAIKKNINGELYIWVSYQKILDDNPILRVNNKRAIANHVDKLIALGLLTKLVSKEDGNKTFFKIEYKETSKSKCEEEVCNNNYKGYVKNNTKGMQEKLQRVCNNKCNNSKLNIDSYNSKENIKESKLKFDSFLKQLLERFTKKSILTYKSKINKTKEVRELYRGLKINDIRKIIEEYPLYVKRNKKYAVRLNKYILAYSEGNLEDIEYTKEKDDKSQNNTIQSNGANTDYYYDDFGRIRFNKIGLEDIRK